MLKVFLGVLVSVVVLLSSAYAPLVSKSAYAASANVMMTRVQAGGVGAATQEFIVIYNNSPDDVDITDWCVTNKSGATIACFTPSIIGQTLYLSGYHYAAIASDSFVIGLPAETVATTYISSNQSSGSITGSADTLSLVDATEAVVDRLSWTTPIPAGMQYERYSVGSPLSYVDTDTASDWAVTLPGMLPVDGTWVDTTIVDSCPNIDGIQLAIPVRMVLRDEGCVAEEISFLVISELLPNAVGADAGQEFIELFNPNDTTVSLADYELFVGPNYESSYYFPDDISIEPHGYISFTNAQIPFTLLNSSSHVLLTLRDGSIISESPAYTDPKEGQSWAFIDDVWVYTNSPTPGSANLSMAIVAPVTDVGAVVRPCADNQYRSLETNRCRSIVTDTKSIVPCKADEERNTATNRCRKIVVATAPAACKDGQERSAETNRCRIVTKMTSASYSVLGAETKSSGNWYVLAAVVGVSLLALGYAIWEWHDEIGKFFRKYYFHVLRFARPRK